VAWFGKATTTTKLWMKPCKLSTMVSRSGQIDETSEAGAPVHNARLEMLEEFFKATRPKLTPSYPYDKRTNKIELPAKIEKELLRLLSTGNKVEAVKRQQLCDL
jgi:hypothetical protein